MSKSSTSITEIFKSFNNLKALVVGDVMIDAYTWGKVNRISPEAPVPVVTVSKKENRLGGAANVALNIQAMGAQPILCSVIGNDDNGQLFLNLLKKQKLSAQGIIKDKKRVTTVKTRIIGGNHQMLRVDEEVENSLSDSSNTSLIKKIKELTKSQKVDVIIFEDYDKGCITPQVIEEVVAFAKQNKIPTVVDPKKKNFHSYTGVTLFKPNLKELKEGLNTEFDHQNISQLEIACGQFTKKQKIDTLLITLSERGIYTHNSKVKKVIPAHVRNISDVSGAGDTVVSVAALCLALNVNPILTATLANLAGGLVCEKVGVVPIDKKQLLQEALLLKL